MPYGSERTQDLYLTERWLHALAIFENIATYWMYFGKPGESRGRKATGLLDLVPRIAGLLRTTVVGRVAGLPDPPAISSAISVNRRTRVPIVALV